MFGNTQMLKQHQKKTKYCLKIQEDQAKKVETISELTCQFCNKQFKTKYLLHIHQTQTKYCLKIQESQNSGKIISSLVTCVFCGKNFSSSHFNRHELTCKKKNQFFREEITRIKSEKDQEILILKMKAEKDQEIAILKIEKENAEEIAILKIEKENAEEIAMLKMKAEIGSIYKESAERAQATIEEIAKQPTYQKNSTRNIQNNLMISSLTPLDLTQARVDSIIDEKYTKNDFYEGQKGAAQIIHKHILTDSKGKSQIVCTDTERGTFHHKDLNGEHVVDYKNAHLIDKVHLPLKRKASKFASEECVKNPTAYKDIVMNESSIRELETKPGLFNRTMAQLTGKKCVRPLLVKSQSNIDLAITEEWLIENAKFLTIEHILRGPEGYADYALSYPLNGRLIEEDYLNPTFIKYKDRSGDIITDYGGKMLTKMLLESVRERTHELIESNDNVTFECEDIEDSIFQDEFISIVMSNI
jgi:hypothetical protein